MYKRDVFTQWFLLLPVLTMGENSTRSDINTSLCGANYDPDEISVDAGNFQAEEKTIYLLAGIYLGCALLGAILIAVTVDPLSRFNNVLDGDNSMAGVGLLVATFKHMANPYQLLIIPLTLWSGFEQAFFGADFTAVTTNVFTTEKSRGEEKMS